MAVETQQHFLDSTHPIYDAQKEVWERNERRLRGGVDVLDELVRFNWEEKNGEHYKGRQAQATYINFPDLYAFAMTGHMLRSAPQPGSGLDFGTLGDPNRAPGATVPTRAELLYFNADGAGSDGSQWWPWWMAVERRAFATGHRWIMVEASEQAPASRADEIRGQRPYLTEYSPLDVTNWHWENGVLMWAIVRPMVRRPKLDGEQLTGGGYEREYLLLVRAGYTDLGDDYAGGGWWKFKPNKDPVEGEGGEAAHGDWSKTDGAIPLFPLFYDREGGARERPSMSRPATTTLGQIAVAYMNQSSAADFDAWDAAKSVRYLLGVDAEQHNVAREQEEAGSQLVAIPRGPDGEVPQMVDGSASAVSSDIFTARLNNKWEEARIVAALETSGAPDSSGISKQMGFADVKEPRLVNAAANLETAMNTALHFLELRWRRNSEKPSGSVEMPRSFDLKDLIASVDRMFDILGKAQVNSPTLDAKLILSVMEDEGFVADDEEKATIEAELTEASRRGAADREAARSLLEEFNEPEPEPEPVE